MARDWDVIRSILLEAENLGLSEGDEVQIDSSADRGRWYNAELLREGGFVEVTPHPYDGGEIIIIDRLTWKGHDLLETLRSRPVWEKIKSIATEKGIEL